MHTYIYCGSRTTRYDGGIRQCRPRHTAGKTVVHVLNLRPGTCLAQHVPLRSYTVRSSARWAVWFPGSSPWCSTRFGTRTSAVHPVHSRIVRHRRQTPHQRVGFCLRGCRPLLRARVKLQLKTPEPTSKVGELAQACKRYDFRHFNADITP